MGDAMRQALRAFVQGFLCGLPLGAGLSLLLSPSAGRTWRQGLRDYLRQTWQASLEVAQAERDHLKERLAQQTRPQP
jgi:gas vesicle protein